MGEQTLLWTPLPNGVDESGNLRLSLLLSPRLAGDAPGTQLDEFPDFLDWPETLGRSEFQLQLNGQSLAVAGLATAGDARVDTRYGLPDGSLWQAMFPANTPVRDFHFEDRINSAVLSYPAAALHERTRKLYQSLAAQAGDSLPRIVDLLNDSAWKPFRAHVAHLDRRYGEDEKSLPRNIEQQFDEFMQDGFSSLPAQRRELARFQLFHTPPGEPQVQDYSDDNGNNPRPRARWRTHGRTALPVPAALAPRYDFHDRVAAMNQYPTLLRRLGLVVDFLVEAGRWPPGSNQVLQGWLKLPRAPRGVRRKPEVPNRVLCRLDEGQFAALPRPGGAGADYQLNDGMLLLGEGHFSLLQVDVDGATLKAMNTARSLNRFADSGDTRDATSRHERNMGVASLRNAGLMLVHNDRGESLTNAFKRNSVINKTLMSYQQTVDSGTPPPVMPVNEPPEFFAEDLVRGFRIDIWDDQSRRWHSLCQRNARYTIDGFGDVVVPVEEGTVRLGATRSPDPGAHPDLLWMHEAVLTWSGWSLCAPQPGKTVGTDDQIADEGAETVGGIPLSSSFRTLPGSLPRLRYGRRYWLRARVVDLASNSLDYDPDDIAGENPQQFSQPYLRYEPIRPPTLALVKPDASTVEAPAEGESMARMAIRTFNDLPAKNTVPTDQVTRRFALAEQASVREAELHGMLDSGGAVDPGFYALLGSKDAPLPIEKIVSSGPLVDFHNQAGHPPVATDYGVLQLGDPMPYLPDPLCLEFAARIFNLPDHDDGKVISIPVYASDGEWPHGLPFQIVIYDDPSDAPHFDVAQRQLRIPLPKAARAQLRLSVKPTKRALELLGVWQWLKPDQQNTLRGMARRGQHWMLTPWRNVDLVHPVQKPLITPDMNVQVGRKLGDTHAVPQIRCSVSIKSTDHVDLLAEWHEPVAKAETAPANRHRNDLAYSLKITDPQGYAEKPDHLIPKPDLILAGAEPNKKMATKVHEFMDTRYRRIEYWLVATTRFREYMPADVLLDDSGADPELTDENIKVVGERAVTWIPASAPPPAPQVLYVIPTFEWVHSRSANRDSSWRRGGGLRVYLDGPWYNSGYGEMLAVVLPPKALGKLDPNDNPSGFKQKKYVTQWGNDPAFKSPYVKGAAPKLASFGLARVAPDPGGAWVPDFAPASEADQPPDPFQVESLTHPAISGQNVPAAARVDIAPHDVHWDEDRGLWYCDIEVDPGASYSPFIRLALARYQPVALADAHLSEIALADFMMLTPDRWLSVTAGRNRLRRQIKLFGRSYSHSSGKKETDAIHVPVGWSKPADVSGKTVVEVWVERHDPALGEDFGWRRDDSVTVRKLRRTRARPLRRETQQRRLSRARKLLQQRRFDRVLDAGLVSQLIAAPSLWEGEVTLPDHSGNQRFRLVVAEYEEYVVDGSEPHHPTPSAQGRRLVFVEHVALDE